MGRGEAVSAQLKLLDRWHRPTLEERWRELLVTQPQIYNAFERITLAAIRRGRRKFGAKAVWERMRWDLADLAVDRGEGEPKLDNSLTALAAREFQRRWPEYVDVFETRERKS